MRNTNHYILEYWDKRVRRYVFASENRSIEMLKKLATKPYFNYPYMGRKRIRYITTKTIWVSR